MQLCLFTLLLFAVGFTEAAFSCYQCSYDKLYNTNQDWNKRDCMVDPHAIGAGGQVQCNSTSYCSYQEMYDISRQEVTSFYRSCKGTSGSSSCIEDWTHVTCSGFCRGDFCTKNETGEHYKIHFG